MEWVRFRFKCDDFNCEVVEQNDISQLKVIGGAPSLKEGWSIWWYEPEGGGEDGYWFRPEGGEKRADREPDKVKPGFAKSQKIWHNNATWRGGLVRQVLMAPGEPVRLEMALKLLTPSDNLGEGVAKIGIDSKGGVDPYDKGIQWSEWQGHPNYDAWLEFVVQSIAGTSGWITIYSWTEWKYRASWNDAFWCDARLYSSSNVVPPPPPPPPTEEYEPWLWVKTGVERSLYTLPASITGVEADEHITILTLRDGTKQVIATESFHLAGNLKKATEG